MQHAAARLQQGQHQKQQGVGAEDLCVTLGALRLADASTSVLSSCLVVRLEQTYRAHPLITGAFSSLFYDDTLVTATPAAISELCLGWARLPCPGNVPQCICRVKTAA